MLGIPLAIKDWLSAVLWRGWRAIGIFLTVFSLLLIVSCGGGGGSGPGGDRDIPQKAEWQIAPFMTNATHAGLRIIWQNLPNFKQWINPQYLLITTISNRSMELEVHNISISDFNNDNTYNLTLEVGVAYRFVNSTIELENSRGISVEWDIEWIWEPNALANNRTGIEVGPNHDGDGLVDRVDDDKDGDGIFDLDDEGNKLDLCPLVASNDQTDTDNDTIGDICDTDDDNDGLLDTAEVDDDGNPLVNNTSGIGCSLLADCDNDGLEDNHPRERLSYNGTSCSLLTDCDGDDVEDDDELADRCVNNEDCDGDDVKDNKDLCFTDDRDWSSSSINDADGDGCHNDEDIDDDNDGLLDTEDIDDDGDSLIEIENADAFNNIRWVLDGSGFKEGRDAELNTTGCGGMDDSTMCHGYELTTNISLTDYADWEPIAVGLSGGQSACTGAKFSGILDGNDFVISDLNINTDGADKGGCKGLFGQANGTIRNLGVIVGLIIGDQDVGGLLAKGSGVTIENSYVIVNDRIDGNYATGGLIGHGEHAIIVNSYAINNLVESLSGPVGGLVGYGRHAILVDVYAVNKKIERKNVGGLVGDGRDTLIVNAWAVNEELFNDKLTPFGGLLSLGQSARIVNTYAVTGTLNGGTFDSPAGLVGDAARAKIIHSYAVSGTLAGRNRRGLVGAFLVFSASTTRSYWDSQASGVNSDKGTGSSGKNHDELRTPTDYDGSIYSDWQNGAMIDDIDSNITIWCDEDQDDVIKQAEMRDGNHVWDFGTTMDYPAIRCTAGSLTDQRSWWYLNATDNNPYLDHTYFNQRLTQ